LLITVTGRRFFVTGSLALKEHPSLQPLIKLGLTDLEARIYVALLAGGPKTGYGVAKSIGKPQANVYKALETLLRKGAVEVAEGDDRKFRATPHDEFLSSLQRTYQAQQRQAREALKGLEKEHDDVRVYRLYSVPQTLERCRRMIEGAERVVILDLWPDLLEKIRPEVEAAADHGVEVIAQIYNDVELPGAGIVVQHPRADQILQRWEGEWLSLIVDGRDFLHVFLEGDRILAGVTGSDSFLAAHFHTWGASEIRLSLVEALLAEEADARTIRYQLNKATELMMKQVTGEWVEMQQAQPVDGGVESRTGWAVWADET
jgi:sugar-specific transcriptional regulator TrmB